MASAPSPSLFSKLVRFAAPIVGLNVLQVLALAVDTAMCGRVENADLALTALGFSTQVVFLLMVAMMGLTIGTVALVARAFGANDHDRVNHILKQSSIFTVILGVVVGGIGILAGPSVLSALGASPPAVELGMGYLTPLLCGATFNYLTVLYGAVLRGVGNTRIPFFVALGANAVNVVVNYALILGNFGMPALGVEGAAIGTLCSQVISVVVLLGLIRRGFVPPLRFSFSLPSIDVGLARTMFRVGTPAALDMVILNAALISIVGMLGRVDEIAVAAHGVGLRVQALAFVPGMSISQATGALVGQALGAGSIDEAKRALRASIVLCTGIMSALAAAIIFAALPIVELFNVQPGTELADYSVMWMELLGYGMPLVGVYISFVGLFQGSGATRLSLGINTVTTLAFQIPSAYVFGFVFDLGAWGVWASFPAGFIIKVLLATVIYKRETWAVVGDSV